LRDLRLLGLGTEADDADVLEAYNRRRSLYEAENLATYSLHSEEARQRLFADLEAALNRLDVKPQTPKAMPKSQPPADHQLGSPVGPEPDRGISPGAFIRYHRLTQGITLAEVALETKIAEARLKAIESEAPTGVPAVYVRGFVVTLANLLGLSDPDRLARTYLETVADKSGERPQV
jgi:hypothetical protein